MRFWETRKSEKKYDELGSNWKQYEQWQQAGGQAGGQPFDASSIRLHWREG